MIKKKQRSEDKRDLDTVLGSHGSELRVEWRRVENESGDADVGYTNIELREVNISGAVTVCFFSSLICGHVEMNWSWPC